MSVVSRGRFAGAGVWASFHLARNLRRRTTLPLVLGGPLLVAVMRWGFGVSTDPLGQLVLVYLVPLMALAYGAGVLREEVEDQTLTYGFTRPVDRAALYVARLIAAAGPVVLATVPAVALAADGPGHAGRLVGAAVLGTAAYVSVFGLCGLLMRRPTWLGLGIVLVWEQGLQSVPGWLSAVTLRTHLRTIGQLDLPSGVPFLGTGGAGPVWVSVVVSVVVTAAAVVGAGAIVRRRELVVGR